MLNKLIYFCIQLLQKKANGWKAFLGLFTRVWILILAAASLSWRTLVLTFLFFLMHAYMWITREIELRSTSSWAPDEYQIGFQNTTANVNYASIVNFHHDVMMVLIFVLLFITVFLFVILWKFQGNAPLVKLIQKRYPELRRNIYAYEEWKGWPKPVTRNDTLEIFWTITPTLILMTILWPSLGLLYGMDDRVQCFLTFKAIGHQWYWSYEFTIEFDWFSLFSGQESADFIDPTISYDSYMINDEDLYSNFRLLAVDKEAVVPYHANLRVLVTATDVIHSWAVPSFGFKMDGCPGRLNQAFLNVFQRGVFYGQCSELCGVQHGFMPVGVLCVSLYNWVNWSLHYYYLFLLEWANDARKDL